MTEQVHAVLTILRRRDLEARLKTPAAHSPVCVTTSPDGAFDWVLSPDHELLGRITNRLNADRKGLVIATVAQDLEHLSLKYVGPEDLAP